MMDGIILEIPYILLGIFSLVFLLTCLGLKYNIKKTLLIAIPITFVIAVTNILIYANLVNYDELLDRILMCYTFSYYIPLSLLAIFLGHKNLVVSTSLSINVFVAYYTVAILMYFCYTMVGLWLVYLVLFSAVPIIELFIIKFYKKLHDRIEELLPKYLWMFMLYGVVVLVMIFIDHEIYLHTKDKFFYLVALISILVYILSILIFYFTFRSYYDVETENVNLNLMKGQIDNIKDQYKLREKKDEEVKILRHDMKHILITVSTLIQNEKYAEALEFINNYSETITMTKANTFCKDPIINSIIDYYESKSKEEDVLLNIKINNIEDALTTPSYETAVLISNCLDNAIKAAKKLKNNRIVDFTFINNDGRLVMQVKNNYDGIILIDKDGRPTNLAMGHGLGSDSIELFAKKYNLTINYDISNNIYKITILF